MTERTEHSGTGHHHFIPGLRKGVPMPLYDVMHRIGRIGALHTEVIRAAGAEPGQRVLDIGCGTGNLLIALGRGLPDLDLAGIDPDPRALRRAGRKTARAGLQVRYEVAFAQELPYPDASVDMVLSTLMFHHLDAPTKQATLAEVRRVLRPGGAVVLADFDGNGHRHRIATRRMAELVRDNGDLPARLAAAGLVPEPVRPYPSRFGEVQIVRASRR
jgi:ubiquinone/menaquinone biosynthesis C-methylase UbiE